MERGVVYGDGKSDPPNASHENSAQQNSTFHNSQLNEGGRVFDYSFPPPPKRLTGIAIGAGKIRPLGDQDRNRG